MYLKQLILKGFKSFADRSVLTLEPGITAVVGPNGSGKSNISDAVLWVLGERNAKNLRGQVMEDVIFAGSSARKSVGVAEVTLVLDNSDGSLPVDFEEVTVSRRMYRNGESEYLINNAVVRRLDVLDILHDSGLGTGTHSIISQGHLDSILQSKPEDRRALIEEAAGVLKHKQRKAKSQRKIEQMDQHLARVNDVVRELDRQLGPLQRKAKRAQQYQEASEQLRDVKLKLAVDDLRSLQRQWDALLASEAAAVEGLEAKRAAVAQAEGAYEEVQEGIRQESADLALLAQKQSRAASLVERFDSLILLLQEKQRTAETRCRELSAQLDGNAAKRAEAQADRERLAAELASVQSQRSQAQKDLEEAQAAFDTNHGRKADLEREVGGLHRRRSDAERDAERLRKDLSRTQESLASSMGRAQVAKERSEELAGQVLTCAQAHDEAAEKAAQAQEALQVLKKQDQELTELVGQVRQHVDTLTKAVDQSRRQVLDLQAEIKAIQEVERAMMAASGPAHAWVAGQSRDSWGKVSPLYDRLKVEPGFEKAVEQLLGDDVLSLLVEDGSRVTAIGQDLAQAGKAGAVRLMVPSAVAAKGGEGAPGVRLLDKVTCSEDIADNAAALLGGVMLVGSLQEALDAHAKDRTGLRFMTPDGEIVFPSGKVLLGHAGAQSGEGALARSQRLAEAKGQLESAEVALAEAQQKAEEARQEARQIQDEQLRVRQQVASAQGEANAAQQQERSTAAALAKVRQEAELSAQQAKLSEEAVAQAQPQVESLKSRLQECEATIDDVKDQIRRKQQELGPVRDQEAGLSQRLADAKLSAATLTERETYAARSVDVRAKELVMLNSADEAALKDLSRKQAVRKRVEPLLEVVSALREGAQEKAAALTSQAHDAQEASFGSHSKANAAREATREAHLAFDQANEALANLRVDKGRMELQVQAAADAIVFDCKTPMEQALQLPELEDRVHWEESSFKLQKRIANMGIINPDAANEYQQLKERYDYLQAQLQDLASARSSLKKIDRIIDERMKDDFANTFQTVNGYFKEIFQVLFPGGSAELILVDPDNMETTGVEVQAQPKGKRITKMTLMSGGEKSLVACALLFAVYRTRSTPFYILDEIEAALDDSNLRRLTGYLRELSQQTQLIMITHQRRTMEMADVLFGVSMQADGVTKVISQRLDKALQYAE